MASGIFAVLDDIAALLDDVAVMSKVAARKTAGILGDDLAVNAEKASGFASERELPVLWAISKGSFFNKLIILPLAFLLSAFLPWAVVVILILGGIYLAYEGAEKIYEFIFPHSDATPTLDDPNLTEEEILAFEKKRVKAAIVTDFILSVEIIIIALGAVVGQPLVSQIVVVTFIAVLATVGVYGIVALIVRMDEVGFWLIKRSKKEKSLSKTFGQILIQALPIVIRSLTVIGTIALILVAGGIFVHNLDLFHGFLPTLPSIIPEFIVGLAVGFLSLFVVFGVKKLIPLLFAALLLTTSCSNNTNESTTEQSQNEPNQQENNALSTNSSSNKSGFIDVSLDSLRSFNSEKELKVVFGDHVKRAIGQHAEGMGEYNNSLLYPDTKNEVEFVWKDDSINFSGLVFLKLKGKDTDWKTEEGITIGTRMKELEEFNKKPFTFYGLGWDYAGTIDWQKGNLYDRKIFGRLAYPEDYMPEEFDDLLGDHEIKSTSELAKKANLILGEIMMEKLNN